MPQVMHRQVHQDQVVAAVVVVAVAAVVAAASVAGAAVAMVVVMAVVTAEAVGKPTCKCQKGADAIASAPFFMPTVFSAHLVQVKDL